MRGVVVSLLPALWLLASGPLLFAMPGGCVSAHCSVLVCVCEQGKQIASPDLLSQSSARPLNRRMVPQSDSDGMAVPVACSSTSLLHLRQAFTSSLHSDAAPGLAQNWQFCWRTALEPRAPSLAS